MAALSSSCSRCLYSDHFFRSRALRSLSSEGSSTGGRCLGTRRAKGVAWRYRPHRPTARDPSVPAGGACGTQGQTKGWGGGCGGSNTGNWAVRFTRRQETAIPPADRGESWLWRKVKWRRENRPISQGVKSLSSAPETPNSGVPPVSVGSDEAAIPATPPHHRLRACTSRSRRPKVSCHPEGRGLCATFEPAQALPGVSRPYLAV